MSQLAMFDGPVPTFPRARISDARSSHEAAAEMERTGRAKAQAERVLTAVRRYPGNVGRAGEVGSYRTLCRRSALKRTGEAGRGRLRGDHRRHDALRGERQACAAMEAGMMLDPIQQAHEDAIQLTYHDMVAARCPRDVRRSYDRMRSLIASRDPEVVVALEVARLERVTEDAT